MADHHKTSADLEREIDAQRLRIEREVDDLTSRLSPGQLLDEALTYTRKGPGADFARNLEHSVVSNPLPVALMGASIAWLIARPDGGVRREDAVVTEDVAGSGYVPVAEETEIYPIAVIRGAWLQRVGVIEGDTTEERHSEFVDDAGRKFRALTDKAGHRAGHFKDEAGKTFRGFIDESGHRVTDFRDEAGERIHATAGWASHNWRKAEEGAARLGRNVRDGTAELGSRARHAGASVRDQASHAGAALRDQAGHAGDAARRQGDHAVHAVDDFVHRQPLIAGALAFAVGAIAASALPRTRQENYAFGEASDSVKHKAMSEAEHLYEEGREQARALHDRAEESVERMHDKATHAAANARDEAKSEVRASTGS